MATLPVVPNFSVSGYTVRDFRALGDRSLERIQAYYTERGIVDELPPECVCQDAYARGQVREAIRDAYGSTTADAFNTTIYPTLLTRAFVQGQFDPIRFLITSGAQPIGGFCWFAISGVVSGGSFLISARPYPMFPTMGPTGRARGMMDTIEAFFAQRWTLSGLVTRIAQAQTYMFRDATRNATYDQFMLALSGELTTRRTRQTAPLTVTQQSNVGLTGRTLVTITP